VWNDPAERGVDSESALTMSFVARRAMILGRMAEEKPTLTFAHLAARSAMEVVAMHRFVSMIVLLAAPTLSLASNENITIVLHARDGIAGCDDPQQQGMDCVNGRPNLDLTGMQMPVVYIMLRNYDNLAGVQCAFDWPATWTFFGGSWGCLPGSGKGVVPTAPGGSIALVFNCINGGALVTMGRMVYGPPVGGGCLSIVESDLPFGNHVIDCSFFNTAPIHPANVGRVCVGSGGYDACWPASTPVENATWGRIKTQYR
jgi:hypothetical protein